MLPIVKLFYGAPSQYWWEDETGVVNEIDQSEGGEQGNAMMPVFLFSLGQHNALHAVQERMLPTERLFGIPGRRVCGLCARQGGCNPYAVGERVVGSLENPECMRVKRRSTTAQGRGQKRATICRGLRREFGRSANIQRQNVASSSVGASNFRPAPTGTSERTPTNTAGPHPCNSGCAVSVGSPVSLRGCANHVLHQSGASGVRRQFFQIPRHKQCGECLCRVLGVPPESCERSARAASQMPLAFGGLGFRSAERTRTPAY